MKKGKFNTRKFTRRQKKQLTLLTFVVLLACIAAVMLLTPTFDINEIKIYGNSVLKRKDIIRNAGIVENENIFSINTGEIEDNIMSMGYIESVKVKRRLPSTIVITVEEEVGVAYLKAEEGYVILAADGRCIEITDGISDKQQSIKAPSLPMIKGLKNVKYKIGKTIKSEDKEQLDALLLCLREFLKNNYVFNMREIDVSDLQQIKFYYRSKDLCVSIGSTDKIGYKMECFGPILKQIGENPTGYIDLERLTYRKTQEKKE